MKMKTLLQGYGIRVSLDRARERLKIALRRTIVERETLLRQIRPPHVRPCCPSAEADSDSNCSTRRASRPGLPLASITSFPLSCCFCSSAHAFSRFSYGPRLRLLRQVPLKSTHCRSGQSSRKSKVKWVGMDATRSRMFVVYLAGAPVTVTKVSQKGERESNSCVWNNHRAFIDIMVHGNVKVHL